MTAGGAEDVRSDARARRHAAGVVAGLSGAKVAVYLLLSGIFSMSMRTAADGAVTLARAFWPKKQLVRILGRTSAAKGSLMARRRHLYHGSSNIVKDIMR